MSKVLGLRHLRVEIERTNKELMEAEDPAAMAAGIPIRDKWKSLVPVLDGNYRDSLEVVWLGKKGAAVGPTWQGHLEKNDQPIMYAKRLEFGESGVTAQPSARPTLEAAKAAAIEAGAEPFRTVIRGRRRKKKVPTT